MDTIWMPYGYRGHMSNAIISDVGGATDAHPLGGLDRIAPLPAQKQQKARTPKANNNSMLLLVLGRKPRTPLWESQRM